MMKRKAAGPPAGGLRRLIRGRTPLKLIPALAACTAKRMKSCAFPSLHPMLAAPKAQAAGEKPRTSGFAACAKVLCTLLQFRNKKPLTSVTIGGNI